MMIRTALALLALTSVVRAQPSATDVAQRKAALERQLAGTGFTVLVEDTYIIVGDEPAAKVKSRATGFFRWTTTLLEKDFFPKKPDKVIEVWLFKNEATYRAGAKKYFDDTPETPYGYYSPSRDALIMNIGLGAGTLSHELVHPYIETNFPAAPAWFNEGLASLYEQPVEKDGRIWGNTNWRLRGLHAMIRGDTMPSLRAMLRTTRDEFYGAPYDAYAMARYLMQYLQDHGKLHDFYARFVADPKDRTGEAALAAVLGQDLATFEPTFKKWALALRRR